MKTAKLFMTIIVLLVTLSKLTPEQIPNINEKAFLQLTDKQKLAILNKIIAAYNKTFEAFIKQKETLETKEAEIEKLKKALKRNIIILKLGYGLNLNLQQNLIIDFSYLRSFVFVGIGGGIGTVLNLSDLQKSIFFINLNVAILF